MRLASATSPSAAWRAWSGAAGLRHGTLPDSQRDRHVGGNLRRPIYCPIATDDIPSSLAARGMVLDILSTTSRKVAFSISENVLAARSRTHARSTSSTCSAVSATGDVGARPAASSRARHRRSRTAETNGSTGSRERGP
jgi:hypothetical protein